MKSVVTRLAEFRLMPVIVIDDPVDAAPLAGALMAGGLPAAEVTLRTPGAVEALRIIRQTHPGVLAGAGTVLSPQQAKDALDAGAEFIVTPGFNPRVVDYCLERNVPIIPGVCTPTEIEMALERGLEVLKFFPAEPMGGIAFLKAICAPYAMLRFVPTGGISERNLGDYLGFPQVLACGGSWMAPQAFIQQKLFERILAETRRAVAAVGQSSGEGR
ncbi:MAG: bifunctional 4-hydroxy-2-oxoglutarate aldolase/2-dehydro-3-deoxy-phosphogluconate aldolase [Gemmatimonadota bacterium]|nr:bifunctional 4-hydroxy-2-oxoglutarate aldolase/2-dehydro-3-deoxy-phosphogluconate aldolase [Gemmatimonadota bacterium]